MHNGVASVEIMEAKTSLRDGGAQLASRQRHNHHEQRRARGSARPHQEAAHATAAAASGCCGCCCLGATSTCSITAPAGMRRPSCQVHRVNTQVGMQAEAPAGTHACAHRTSEQPIKHACLCLLERAAGSG